MQARQKGLHGHPPIPGFIDNAFRSNPFVFRSGGSCQKPAAEPAANGLIIELQAGVGDGDSSDQQQCAPYCSLSRGNLILHNPSSIDVDQRIVCDVKGVGQVSKETGYPDRRAVRALLACTDGNDERKEEDDAKRFVEAVHPMVLCAAKSWQGECHNQQEAADAEGSLDVNALSKPHEEDAREKREQQAGEANVKFLGIESPTANHVATSSKDGELHKETCSEHHENGQNTIGQLAKTNGIKNVRDVFEEQRPGGAVERVHLIPAANVH